MGSSCSEGRASPLSRRQTGHNGKPNPRDSIIAIAIDLFSRKGYNRTSLSEIARQMGMDPSSLYYYFPSKSALIEGLFTPGYRAPNLDDLSRFSASRTEQLYALIVHDTVHKCELPFDFIEMESVANEHPELFTSFFENYRAFYNSLVDVIELGIAEGEFVECAADERAVTILSITEGLQHHFHAKNRGELLLEVSGYAVRNHTPEEIGHLSAESVMPALVKHPENFSQAAENGFKLYCRVLEAMEAERQ